MNLEDVLDPEHGKREVKTKQKLYLMKNEVGLYKIGISTNPERRCREVSNSSGIPTNLVSVWETEPEALVVEQKLHKHFQENRKMGEWFSFISCPKGEIERLYDGGKFSTLFPIKVSSQEITRDKKTTTFTIKAINALEQIHATVDVTSDCCDGYWSLIATCLREGVSLKWLKKYGFIVNGRFESKIDLLLHNLK